MYKTPVPKFFDAFEDPAGGKPQTWNFRPTKKKSVHKQDLSPSSPNPSSAFGTRKVPGRIAPQRPSGARLTCSWCLKGALEKLGSTISVCIHIQTHKHRYNIYILYEYTLIHTCIGGSLWQSGFCDPEKSESNTNKSVNKYVYIYIIWVLITRFRKLR